MSDVKREMEELRQRRAQIDREILALLARRARLSKEWGAARADEPAKLPSTERDTLDELAAAGAGDLPAEAVRAIFREIHAACRALEAPVRVAVVGAEGGVEYGAARRQFGPLSQITHLASAPQALDAVEAKQVDFAVLPYETHSEGVVPDTLQALRFSEARVVALSDAPRTLALLNRSGRAADVAKVYATAHDRLAAQQTLATQVPSALFLEAPTALDACRLASGDEAAAAVGLAIVGQGFDLQEIAPASAVAEGPVRLCVAALRPASRTGRDVTALLFTVNDEPGALFETLKFFAERGVNLRKIQSRPSKDEGYLFFVEISGHITDRSLVTALEGVKKQTRTLKILGSFPA